MRARRTGRLAALVILAITVSSLFAGYALAAVSLVGVRQGAQGELVQHSGTVPGLFVRAVIYGPVPNVALTRASTNPRALSVLAMGTSFAHIDRYCAGPCTRGQYAELFQQQITAQAAAEGMEMVISASSGVKKVSITVYFSIPVRATGATATTLDVYVDLTAASSVVTATTAFQLCSSATRCP
jgi:hypothetical protein